MRDCLDLLFHGSLWRRIDECDYNHWSTMASSELLKQIQAGKSLKKAVTNDRSGPAIGGSKSGGGGTVGGAGHSAPTITSAGAGSAGPPQIGGLFSGGIPKLKPAGSSGSSLDMRYNTFLTYKVQHQPNHLPNRHLFLGEAAQHRSLRHQRPHLLYLPRPQEGRCGRGLMHLQYHLHPHHQVLRVYRLVCRHLVRQVLRQRFPQPRHPPLQRPLHGDLAPLLHDRILNYALFLQYPHGGSPLRLKHRRHPRPQRRSQPCRLATSLLLLLCLHGKDQAQDHWLWLDGRARLPLQQGLCHPRPLASHPRFLHEECLEERTSLLPLLVDHQHHLNCPLALGRPLRATHRLFEQILLPGEV